MIKLNVREKVERRSKGLCEICFSPNGVEQHHIIKGRGKRTECETEHSVIALCWNCHYGNKGVHGRDGKELNDCLVNSLEKRYKELGYKGLELDQLMGRKPFKTVNQWWKE